MSPHSPRYRHTDGGRSLAGLHEKRDCVVRALAVANDMPYTVAHRVLADLGRKPGKGFRFALVARRFGFTELVQPMRGRGRSRVKTLLARLNVGRFVFRIRGHVFAVVDGVVHDETLLETLENCIVTRVWRVDRIDNKPTCATVAPAI